MKKIRVIKLNESEKKEIKIPIDRLETLEFILKSLYYTRSMISYYHLKGMYEGIREEL